jgi:hypothetical protein
MIGLVGPGDCPFVVVSGLQRIDKMRSSEMQSPYAPPHVVIAWTLLNVRHATVA